MHQNGTAQKRCSSGKGLIKLVRFSERWFRAGAGLRAVCGEATRAVSPLQSARQGRLQRRPALPHLQGHGLTNWLGLPA